MKYSNICITFSLIVSTSLAFDKSFRCGDDWFAFNDEKCYKLVNRSLTRDQAISACGEVMRTSYMSAIVTIKSKSEQKFLENYLFNELGINQNMWIGAKRDNNTVDLPFEWEDGSKIHYQNWEYGMPSNDPDSTCVQMKQKGGKWVDLSCDRTGVVICEKLQIWTFPDLLNSYFDWRRYLEHKNEGLEQSLLKKDLKIAELEKSMNTMNKRLSSLSSELDELRNDFELRLNTTYQMIAEKNKKTDKRLSDLDQKTDRIVDGMLALHEECSNGCSGNSDGPSDSQLESIKKEIIKEVDQKLEPIEDKLDNTVTDARLAIISYRRTLQIKKGGDWISLGYV